MFEIEEDGTIVISDLDGCYLIEDVLKIKDEIDTVLSKARLMRQTHLARKKEELVRQIEDHEEKVRNLRHQLSQM